MDWREDFYKARWHLDVAKRMLVTYGEYPEKRVLIGVIREAAKASGGIVRAFLIRENVKGNLNTFENEVALKYLDAVAIDNLIGILKIERDQRIAKVEFLKGDSILMEVSGRWKVLSISRLNELVGSLNSIIEEFPADIKR